MKILFVRKHDEWAHLTRLIGGLVGGLGHEVDGIDFAENAADILKSARAKGKGYDAVLVDCGDKAGLKAFKGFFNRNNDKKHRGIPSVIAVTSVGESAALNKKYIDRNADVKVVDLSEALPLEVEAVLQSFSPPVAVARS